MTGHKQIGLHREAECRDPKRPHPSLRRCESVPAIVSLTCWPLSWRSYSSIPLLPATIRETRIDSTLRHRCLRSGLVRCFRRAAPDGGGSGPLPSCHRNQPAGDLDTRPRLLHLELALATLFFGFVTAVLLRRVFTSPEVTAETLYGAINAYLLLGLTWGGV
jgi:hypothetical protein